MQPNEGMAAFAACLWRQGSQAPAGWLPALRIAIHRNNVYGGLLSVLAARFPVVRRLLGTECFDACAVRFVAAEPPRSPVLMSYGAGLADFLATLPELRSLGYLPDVARLEWARHEAMNGPDAPVLMPEDLGCVPPARMADLVLETHPTARVLWSDYPIQTIWRANADDASIQPVSADLPGEAVLVARRLDGVVALALQPGQAAFLASLAQGKPLLDATDACTDWAAALAMLLQAGAFTRFSLHNIQD